MEGRSGGSHRAKPFRRATLSGTSLLGADDRASWLAPPECQCRLKKKRRSQAVLRVGRPAAARLILAEERG